MKDNKFTIRIESILGGHSPLTHFAAPDQFRSSIGIDPALPLNDDTDSTTGTIASGLLRPVGVSNRGTTSAAPLWIIPQPKSTTTYVYDAGGSVYSFGPVVSLAGIGDLTDGGNASGNGAAYYDNYIYFSRNTTIARYGPLNGTSAFTDDYWVSTLGKTALGNNNSSYPYQDTVGVHIPDHYLHRHSDGRLYIADVVDNKGTIHYISTTKTTVEGDTDNGSTYNKVQVGYGLWPTAIESYGSDLVIALYEGAASISTNNVNRPNAKIAFWDTSSTNVNKITWVEFPDPLITGLKNINGVLYVISGAQVNPGYRISRFVGGYTFEEVYYSEVGETPLPGALDGNANRFLFGTYTTVPEPASVVFSYGLQKSMLGQGLFNTMRATGEGGRSAGAITALSLIPYFQNIGFQYNQPAIGWFSGGSVNGVDVPDIIGVYDNAPSVWWSQMFRIGQPFKITKIRMPFASAVGEGVTVTPTIYTDDGTGTQYSLAEVNNINDSGKRNIIRRSGSSGEPILGQHNFWLGIRWTGKTLATIGLPITIEGEIIDD